MKMEMEAGHFNDMHNDKWEKQPVINTVKL